MAKSKSTKSLKSKTTHHAPKPYSETMEQVRSAICDMEDVHGRLANLVATLLVIAEQMSKDTLTQKALCFVVDHLQGDINDLERLIGVADEHTVGKELVHPHLAGAAS